MTEHENAPTDLELQENAARWSLLALVWGYNELAKIAETLGEKVYLRLARDHAEDEYRRMGGKITRSAEEKEPALVLTQHAPHIIFYERDIELMRAAVQAHDEAHGAAKKTESEVESLRAQLLEALAERNQLGSLVTNVLRMHLSYSLPSVLEHLVRAVDHLLHDHSCDGHGYEVVGSARDAAQEILNVITTWEPGADAAPWRPALHSGIDWCHDPHCADPLHHVAAGDDWKKHEEPVLCKDAQKNVLVALRRFRDIDERAPSLYDLGCVISIREDQKQPSDSDVLRALQPLLDEGVVVEDFSPSYLARHFRVKT